MIHRCLLFLLLVSLATSCVREVTIENARAEVTSVGPLADSDGNVLIYFTLRDLEGDDQAVGVDICDAPGVRCGVAFLAGGDALDRLPTIPKDSDVLHETHWHPGCGRYIDDDFVAQSPADDFVVAVYTLPSDGDAVYSEPTSLAALGVTANPCE